jgi:CRP-like cAMP-binding protein
MTTKESAFQKFVQLVDDAVAPLTMNPSVVERLAETATFRDVDKGEHLLEADQVVGNIFFVNNGLIRYYFIDERAGEERTGQFFDANTVYTDVLSFGAQIPSSQYIQALEPSEILSIPRHAIYESYADDHALERFGRLMFERALIGSQIRTASFMIESVEERYRKLISNRRSLARRVPQYILATYLGITPEALSRIRRRSTHVESSSTDTRLSCF